MLKIKLIVFGKLAKMHLPIEKHYLKNLETFARVEIFELSEIVHKNLKHQKFLNTQKLLDFLNFANDNIFILSKTGKEVSSENLAHFIKNKTNLIFVIGPSHGFDEALIKDFQRLSFGKLTFQHQLFRILFEEQLFRALAINQNHPYHK